MLNSKFVVVFVASYVQDTSYTQCKCTVVLSSCSCVRLDYGLIKLKGKRKISILIWIRVYNFLTGGCWLGCDLNDFSQASLLTSKKLQQLEALSILVTINLRSLNILHTFWNILEFSACILEYSGTFWNILAMSGTFWNILWNILEHSGTFWNILEHSAYIQQLFSCVFKLGDRQTDRRTDRRTLGLVELRLRS